MIVTGGTTDVTTYFVLRDASDGTAATGLTITGLDLQYVRSGVAPSVKVDATALAATDSAHADNKAIEIDGTDAPGLYRVDWPDAAFAAGVREVILTVKDGGGTAFTEHLRVQIDAPVNTVAVGGTSQTAGDLADLITTVDTVVDGIQTDLSNGTDGLGAIKTDTAAILADTGTDGVVVASIATDAVDAGALATDAVNEIVDQVWDETIAGHTTAGTTGQSLFLKPTAATVADAVWDELQSGHVDAGSFGEVATEVASILADTNELQTDDVPSLIAAVETDTQDIQSRLPAALVNSRMDSTIDGTGMESGAVTNILTTQMTESYASNGTAPTLAQAQFAIHQMLMQFGISGTSLTVRKLDDSTTAFVVTLDSASAPTDASRT